MLGLRAVDPDRVQRRCRRRECGRVLDRLARARRGVVRARERQPRGDAVALQRLDQRPRLVEVGNRLDGEHVRPRGDQHVEPLTVERDEVVVRDAVAPAVLRAVVQGRAVGTDRRSDEHRLRSASLRRDIARLADQRDRERQQPVRLVGARPVALEAGARRLVGRRDPHRRTGGEVRRMHVADRRRVVAQQPGRPERPGQVVPACLELGGEPAVDRRAARPQEVVQGGHRVSRSRAAGSAGAGRAHG